LIKRRNFRGGNKSNRKRKEREKHQNNGDDLFFVISPCPVIYFGDLSSFLFLLELL
jgi:hypothetical protein